MLRSTSQALKSGGQGGVVALPTLTPAPPTTECLGESFSLFLEREILTFN